MYYTIKEVKPKNGVMREIHNRMLGCRCYVLDLDTDQRGYIKCEFKDDPGVFHTIATSNVVSFSEKAVDDTVSIRIVTENTEYYLERRSAS